MTNPYITIGPRHLSPTSPSPGSVDRERSSISTGQVDVVATSLSNSTAVFAGPIVRDALLKPSLERVALKPREALISKIRKAVSDMPGADRPRVITEVYSGGGWHAASLLNGLIAAGEQRLAYNIIDRRYPRAAYGSYPLPAEEAVDAVWGAAPSADPRDASLAKFLNMANSWAQTTPEALLSIKIYHDVACYVRDVACDPALASDIVFAIDLPRAEPTSEGEIGDANMVLGQDGPPAGSSAFQLWLPETHAPDYHFDLARDPFWLQVVNISPTTVEQFVHPAGWSSTNTGDDPTRSRIPTRQAMIDGIGQVASGADARFALWHYDPRVSHNEACHVSGRHKPYGRGFMLTQSRTPERPITYELPLEGVGADREVCTMPQLSGWGHLRISGGGLYQRRAYGDACSLIDAMRSPDCSASGLRASFQAVRL